MKNLILLIAVLIVSACASMPTVKSVAGTYEGKNDDGDIMRMVLLKNGVVEGYVNGKKKEGEDKWKITKEGELHGTDPDGALVFRINKDRSITVIAGIPKDGKRIDIPKEQQLTFKKIK